MSSLVPFKSFVLQTIPPDSINPAVIYLAKYDKVNTRRTYRQCLHRMACVFVTGQIPEDDIKDNDLYAFQFNWQALTYQYTVAMRSWLMSHYDSASTINTHLAALRGVLKECWRLGLMDAEQYQRAVDLDNVTEDRLPAGRELTTSEQARLLAECYRDGSPAGARDGAMIACLLVGLRRSEVVKLDRSDYERSGGKLTIRRAKRNKDRTVYIPTNGRAYMNRWLDVRGDSSGALFVPVYSSVVKIDRENMNSQAVYDIVHKRALDAEIENFTIHDFRRTFIGNMLEIADISIVAQLAGHSNVNTTRKYDRRPEEAKRDAMNGLFIPPPPDK